MNKFYSMEKVGNTLDISIFGDITSYQFFENDITEYSIDKQTKNADVERINVHISSYGGEVKAGLAIYNLLKNHNAKIVTYCDGFACSIASVIFMAGDERIMNDSSALMIHNAWGSVDGNAEQLRKQADDLDKITQLSVTAYKAHSALSEEEIKDLMNKESWLLPDEALEYGFATGIEKTENKTASQNAKMRLLDIIKVYRQEADTQEADEDEEENTENGEDEETDTEDEKAEDEENNEEESPDDTAEDEPPEDEDGEKDEKKSEQSISEFFKAILKM